MGEHLSLVTAHSGTLIVMDFVRKGFNGAEPRFGIRKDNMGGLMEKASKLDEDGIDHPDARLISIAPELLEACKAVREQLISHMTGVWPGTMSITAKRIDDLLREVIAKAERSGL